MQMLVIDHDSIASFDKTNTYFSPASATTLDRKGNKTLAVRTPGSSQRCSVMLGVTGEGKPFQPYLIFKGKYGPTGHIYRLFQRIYQEKEIMRNDPTHLPGRVFGRYPTRCYYSVQENTWNDSIHMIEWIKYVWQPWTETKNKPTMLILDEFTGHMTAEVRSALAKCGTHVEYIPGGFASNLQVMDVGFNKPFKDRYRHQFDHFCRTSATLLRREDVSTWVQNSWEALSLERIATNTWRRVGLPQPMNNDVFVGAHPLVVVHIEDDDENIDAVRGDDDQQEQGDLWMYDDTVRRMVLNDID